MGWLTAGVLDALGSPAGLAGDAPDVPSAPVEIGTTGVRRGASEAGSWQVLLVMFALVLVLGAVVLMYAVRQRTRVLKRRRVRRMGEVAAMVAAMADGDPAAVPPASPSPTPSPMPSRTSSRTAPRTTPVSPKRPSPNA